MKVVEIAEFGGPEVLYLTERPDPEPGPGEVLVAIRAASVNAADWKVRRGKSMLKAGLPHVLGRDFSGVVTAAGPDCDLAPGTEVFGVCPGGMEGAYATAIVIEARYLARKPESLDHIRSAAIALAGLTAMVTLEETLDLQRGERILIQGGAGGVGGMAVQLARHLGAHVVSTGRAVNHDYIRDLGAHEVIDYTAEDVAARLGDCDAAFDTVGTATEASTFGALRSGGRAAFIGAGAVAPEAPRSDVTALRPDVQRSRDRMERLARYIDKGVLRAPEVETLPLSDARRAHEASEAGHVRGKLVLIPDG